MEMVLIIVRQTIVMFLYMLIGCLLYQTGKLSKQGSQDIASLSIWLIIPVVLINSFCVPFSAERLRQFGVSTLLGFVSMAISIVISRAMFPKKPIDNFASTFSNAGFIGIPLVRAALGEEAVFYLVGITATLNILQWNYGVMVLTGKKSSAGLRSMLLNPILIGSAIGMVIFFTGMGDKMPSVISDTLHGISALNAPLAMLVLGVYFAQSDPLKTFLKLPLYKVSFVRLLAIPLVTLLVLHWIPCDAGIKMAILLASAAPSGANVAVYSQLHGMDYPYACQCVAMTTLFSIITIPAVIFVEALL